MPALIVFTSPGEEDDSSKRGASRLRVKEDPKAVVEKLIGAENGFAEFSAHNKPGETVWVNRDQVQQIRSVSG